MHATIKTTDSRYVEIENVKTVYSYAYDGTRTTFEDDSIKDFNLGHHTNNFTIIGDQIFTATRDNTLYVLFG